MPVTREKLYEAVWSKPVGEVAKNLEISGSFLARVCRQLNVPRPPRGYWVKLKFGKAPAKPPLPPARPGDALEWRRDGVPGARVPPTPPAPPATLPQRQRQVPVAARHPLIWGVQPSFEATRTSHSYSAEARYLRPYKRNLPDIFVSKEQLVRALDLANDLYRFLEGRGHRVVLAPNDGHWYTRPRLAYDGKTQDRYWDREPWTPQRPTVAFFGSVAIGLTVYEPSENVDARWVDGKPVRVSDLPPPARRSRVPVYDSTSKWELPSRRLAVRAYSPYRGTTWEKVWQEGRPGGRITFANILRELLAAAAPVAAMVAEAERKRKEEQEQHEAEARRWRIEEARRKMTTAVEAAKTELVAIIESWSFAVRVEHFFEEVATRANLATESERDALAARAAKAREFLGGVDALQRLRCWRTPIERLSPEELAFLSGDPSQDSAHRPVP